MLCLGWKIGKRQRGKKKDNSDQSSFEFSFNTQWTFILFAHLPFRFQQLHKMFEMRSLSQKYLLNGFFFVFFLLLLTVNNERVSEILADRKCRDWFRRKKGKSRIFSTFSKLDLRAEKLKLWSNKIDKEKAMAMKCNAFKTLFAPSLKKL